MSNPSQLFLLADHVKLSLLERQRAVSLNLEPNAQDGSISRSLETMREGVEALEAEAARSQDESDPSAATTLDQAQKLRAQYSDLNSQFTGAASADNASIARPNDPALAPDFAHAATATASASAPSPAAPTPARSPGPATSKSVRFRDSPAAEDPARAQLFPYRDDPSALEAGQASADQSGLSNQQVHAYHAQVLAEQDDALDALGASIGRQRELGARIGDELDEHVLMLDDVDRTVDRHQGRLGGARERIGKIARRANDNKQITVIVVLIVILLLLIIVLKT